MHGRTLLEVREVSKTFWGLQALTGVNLQLGHAEMLGLVGPNGAGKTTLFNVISGFDSQDIGQVRLDNREISKLSPHDRCHLGIARTFQTPKPFLKLTVLDNVAIGAHFGSRRSVSLRGSRAEALSLLRLVGMESNQAALAAELSLGQRRRLELARALATRPRVLLLDEALAGLDTVEASSLLDLLRSIHASGVAVLLIDHVMPLVMGICQRIHVLDHGQTIAVGLPCEVAQDSRVIAAYLGRSAHVSA